MKYLPNSAPLKQHLLSDGPYRVTSYSPGEGFTFDRNPAWEQSTDSLRHAYVDRVVITEGLTPENIQEQLEAGTGDLEFDVGPPTQDIPSLEGSPDLVIEPPGGVRFLALNLYAGQLPAGWFVKHSSTWSTRTPSSSSMARRNWPRSQASSSCQATLVTSRATTPTRTTMATGTLLRPGLCWIKRGTHGRNREVGLPERFADVAHGSVAPGEPQRGGVPCRPGPGPLADVLRGFSRTPAPARRDAWDVALMAWGPDWLGDNGRSTLQPLFTGSRSLHARLRWLLGPSNRLLDQ